MQNAFIELCELTKIAPASVSSKRIVRQTGKIRTVLHTQKDQVLTVIGLVYYPANKLLYWRNWEMLGIR